MKPHTARLFLALLLVANAAVFAIGWFASPPGAQSDAAAVREELNADQIRIVRDEPEPVAPPPPPPPAEVCLEWGPFTLDELARARDQLLPYQLGTRLTSTSVPAVAAWWVYIPPRKTREAADKEVARLNAIGVKDTYVVQDASDMRFAISLGIFRTEEAAQRYAQGLRARGMTAATVGTREHQIRLSALVLRGPSDAEAQRFAELQTLFSGTEVRAVNCAP